MHNTIACGINFVVDIKGNILVVPKRGSVKFKANGDIHTRYSNGSNAQRLNPNGHANNPIPHRRLSYCLLR